MAPSIRMVAAVLGLTVGLSTQPAHASPGELSRAEAVRATAVSGPVIGVAPPSHDFGRVLVGACPSFDFTLSNTGDADLNISSVTASVPEFTTMLGSSVVPPGGTTSLTVQFCPTVAVPSSGLITIQSDAPGSPSVDVAVNGSGDTAPVLLPIGDKTAAPFVELAFDVLAVDAEDDSLAYSASGLPVGATLDATTGHFAWTPQATDAGAYPVTFSVTDGLGSASESIVITVVSGTNAAPVFSDVPSQYYFIPGVQVSFAFTASDPDSGDTVQITASGLPSFLTLETVPGNPATANVSGTPSFADTLGSPYVVNWVATDGRGGSATAATLMGKTETSNFDPHIGFAHDDPNYDCGPGDLNRDVIDMNACDVLTIPIAVAAYEANTELCIPTMGVTLALDDIGGTATFASWAGGVDPSGQSVLHASIVLQPPVDQADGTYTVFLKATDTAGEYVGTCSFTVRVHNPPPPALQEFDSSPNSITLDEGQGGTMSFIVVSTATACDGHTNDPLTVTLDPCADGNLHGLVASMVHVSPAVTPPGGGTITVQIDPPPCNTVVAPMTQRCFDLPILVTSTLHPANQIVVHRTLKVNDFLTCSPLGYWLGLGQVVEGPAHPGDIVNIPIGIVQNGTNQNQPAPGWMDMTLDPTACAGDQILALGGNWDPGQDVVIYVKRTDLNCGPTYVSHATPNAYRQVLQTPTGLTMSLLDDGATYGICAYQPTASPPRYSDLLTVGPLTVTNCTGNSALSPTVSAALPPHFVLTMLSGAPLGATFTDAGDNTGSFSWVPSPTQVGTHVVRFAASSGDTLATDTLAVTLEVVPVNHPPAANAGGPYVGVAGAPITFDGSQSSDPDGDALTYHWDFGDLGVAVGAMPTHTYASASTTPYAVTLAVSDGSLGDSTSTTATIADAYPARIFTSGGKNKRIRIGGVKSSAVWCAQVEPIDNAFSLSAVVAASLTLSYGNAQISAVADKNLAVGDTDGDGVADLSVCFRRSDLATLGFPQGTNIVSVTLAGDLTTGGRFSANLLVEVSNQSGSLAASMSPNPFNPSGTLTVTVPRQGFLRIKIYDLTGRMVRSLRDESSLAAGTYDIPFDGYSSSGNRLASGVYFYRIETASGVTTGRFAILK